DRNATPPPLRGMIQRPSQCVSSPRHTDPAWRQRMKTKPIWWNRFLKLWFAAVVLAMSAVSIALAVAPGRPYRVAVLTPGLPFNLALEGLREGLMQLGYHEGKDITFLVEDAQGEVASLASRAAKIVEAKPHAIFTIGTVATAIAKQATTTLPIVFTFVGDPL